MAGKLTPEQRQAQRVILAMLRTHGYVDPGSHVAIWRRDNCAEFARDADETSELLAILEVPHHRVPATGSYGGRRVYPGEELRVAWADRAALARWYPSLREVLA